MSNNKEKIYLITERTLKLINNALEEATYPSFSDSDSIDNTVINYSKRIQKA